MMNKEEFENALTIGIGAFLKGVPWIEIALDLRYRFFGITDKEIDNIHVECDKAFDKHLEKFLG